MCNFLFTGDVDILYIFYQFYELPDIFCPLYASSFLKSVQIFYTFLKLDFLIFKYAVKNIIIHLSILFYSKMACIVFSWRKNMCICISISIYIYIHTVFKYKNLKLKMTLQKHVTRKNFKVISQMMSYTLQKQHLKENYKHRDTCIILFLLISSFKKSYTITKYSIKNSSRNKNKWIAPFVYSSNVIISTDIIFGLK